MKYFISFIEECVMNPLYRDYMGGRIEVHEQDAQFSTREIRFFTKDMKKFRAYREYWDMREISERQLQRLEDKVEKEFCQFPKG